MGAARLYGAGRIETKRRMRCRRSHPGRKPCVGKTKTTASSEKPRIRNPLAGSSARRAADRAATTGTRVPPRSQLARAATRCRGPSPITHAISFRSRVPGSGFPAAASRKCEPAGPMSASASPIPAPGTHTPLRAHSCSLPPAYANCQVGGQAEAAARRVRFLLPRRGDGNASNAPELLPPSVLFKLAPSLPHSSHLISPFRHLANFQNHPKSPEQEQRSSRQHFSDPAGL